jgi:hypothetical protein
MKKVLSLLALFVLFSSRVPAQVGGANQLAHGTLAQRPAPCKVSRGEVYYQIDDAGEGVGVYDCPNNAWRKLTSDLASQGTLASRPAVAPSNKSRFYFATDVAGGTLYVSTGSAWVKVGLGLSEGGGGVLDHGALTGLGDDDHPQYQLRSEKNALNGYAGLDGSGLVPDIRLPSSVARDTEVAAAVAAHEAASDPHAQYLTNARGDVRYAPLTHLHIIADVTGLQPALDLKADASALTTEAAARASADSAEAGARASADTTLQTNITAEATARALADTALQANVDAKQPLDADLTAVAALSPADGDVIQRTAGAWVNRTMAQLKTSLALTTTDVAEGSRLYWTQGRFDTAFGVKTTSDLAEGSNLYFTSAERTKLAGVATGATANSADATLLARGNHTGFQTASTISDFATAADARVAAAVGVSVQAQDAELAAFAGLTSAADKLPYFTGSGAAVLADFTSFGRSLVDDADAAAGRATLGLGTAATQASSAFQATLGFTPENAANKDAASGYAGLDANTLLKAAEFPAFTGDVTKAAGSLATTVSKVNGNTPGGTCTSQFVRSLSSSAVPTCATVAPADTTNIANTNTGNTFIGNQTVNGSVLASAEGTHAVGAQASGRFKVFAYSLSVGGGAANAGDSYFGTGTSAVRIQPSGFLDLGSTVHLRGSGGDPNSVAADVGMKRDASGIWVFTDGGSGSGTYYSRLKTDTFAASQTLNFALGNVHTLTLTGNVTTLTLSNLKAGAEYTLRVVQDATGSRTITWGASVKWVGGAAPTLSTGASKVDIFKFLSPDGSTLEELVRALDVR